MLLLSFALKTAGQIFYLITAVLLFALGGVVCVFKKQWGLLLSLIILGTFCVRILFVLTVEVENSHRNCGEPETITAVVMQNADYFDDTDSFGRCNVVVKDSRRGTVKKGSVISFKGDGVSGLAVGDKISADILLSDFKNEETALSYYSENIFTVGEVTENLAVIGRSKGIYALAGKVNGYIKNCLENNTENGGVLLALMTGDRTILSDDLYEKVKVAGVSHVLVVSGMHLSILCGFLFKLLNFIKCNDFLKDTILLLFLFIMMCVCGFSMSMLRAGIVYVVIMVYRRLLRRTNSLLCLADAVIIVLFIHPFAVHSVVFGLSFASTFGILVLSEKIGFYLTATKKLNVLTQEIVSACSVSLSAYIATIPIVVYNFGYISTYAILVNVLISFVSTAMLVLSVLGVAFGFIPFIRTVLLFIADKSADYFIFIVELANKMPVSVIPFRNSRLLAVLIVILISLFWIIKNKQLIKIIKGRK
ncbi:MAG: ComEC/Rec2 family competence protein [Acutalibacteraceae bacterium]|nr:ComEC/Rec2 family competence protein [Acutalibacteraceae bacterium]